MFRFSHCAVAVGYVPSGGRALTGSRSPSPTIIWAVTFCTNGGASAGTGGRTAARLVTRAGSATSWSAASALSTASQFLRTTAPPRRP
jgi:hypothetical protein